VSSTTMSERVSTLEARADDMDARADALEAKGEAGQGRIGAMETRQGAVEAKVKELDVFAGPGQNVALSESMVEIRKKLDLVLKNQEKFGGSQSSLEAGFVRLEERQTGLEVGFARLEERQTSLEHGQDEIKGTLALILERLPARPSDN